MNHKKTILFLYFFCGLFFFTRSQIANFTNYNVDVGLAQSEINAIKADSRGYIWFCTSGGGLNQFDGIKFIAYEEKDGLPSNILSSIDEDNQGNMWIGTYTSGISKFDGNKFTTYNKENGLISNEINFVCADNKGKIFAASNHSITLIEDKSFSNFHPDIFSNLSILDMYKDKENKIWIITDKALYLYNGYSLVNMSIGFKLDIKVISVAQDNNGNIWLATENAGLYILSKTKSNTYNLVPYANNERLNVVALKKIIFDKKNNLWAITNFQGIVQYNFKELIFYKKENGLVTNALKNVEEDRFGNLWFGSYGNGFIKYTPGPFYYFDNVEGLNASSIFSIIKDDNNNVWCTNIAHGVYMFDGKVSKNFTSKDGLVSDNIRTIVKDNKGGIYFGGQYGVSYFKNGSFKTIKFTDAPTDVRMLLFDSKNNLWIGTSGKGLFKISETGAIENFTESKTNSINMNYVHSLYEDKKGTVWIGTGAGVNAYRNNKMENFRLSSGFCNSYISSITEDAYGHTWFGTDKCIVVYNGLEFKSYGQESGLTSGTVFLMNKDDKGNIWVGTNKGVDRLIVKPNGDIQSIKNYGIDEGFKGLECNSRATYKDIDGNLYFGTVKGMIKYVPKDDIENEAKPSLHLTDFKLFSQTANWQNLGFDIHSFYHLPINPSLEYNQNYITFNYIGINLHSPHTIKYEYKLEGIDKDWLSDNTLQATYTNLPPGNYKFHVRAFGTDKNIYDEIVYPFKIKRAIWQQFWFIFLMISLFIIGVLFIIQYRTKKINLSKLELEKKVNERTIEIIKQKEEIETLFKEVHHRVKNNLQVISSILNLQSSYIDDEKISSIFKDCQDRIHSMAVIHERLYETNELSEIDVKDYIYRLTTHLKETYSLKNNFSYELNINVNKLNIDTIIPLGLLINEVISNALKYAFPTNEGNIFKITIKPSAENQFEMIIGDNGIGYDMDFKEETADFGLELIKILAEQLNGSIEKLDEKGTVYLLKFRKIGKIKTSIS